MITESSSAVVSETKEGLTTDLEPDGAGLKSLQNLPASLVRWCKHADDLKRATGRAVDLDSYIHMNTGAEGEWKLVILPRQRAKDGLGAGLMPSTLLLHPIY